MSDTTTTPLTLNTPSQLKAPANQSGPMGVAAVVLQNQSPYRLDVQFGGDTFSLPPYMADLFDLSNANGQPVTVTPHNTDQVPAGIPANVTGIWYLPDEAPASGFPATITPPAIYSLIVQQSLAQATADAIAASTLPNETAAQIQGSTLATDTGSATATGVNTLGVPIVQSGGRVFSNNAIPVKGTAPFSSAPLDLLNYQAITLEFSTPTDITTNQWQIDLSWQDGAGNQVAADTLTRYAKPDLAHGDDIVAYLQTKGRFLVVTISNESATNKNAALNINGMTDPPLNNKMTSGDFLLNANAFIAAGTTSTYWINPGTDLLSLYLTTGAPGNKLVVTVSALTGLLVEIPFFVYRNTGTSVAGQQGEGTQFNVPFGRALRIDIANNDTVDRSPAINILDVAPS